MYPKCGIKNCGSREFRLVGPVTAHTVNGDEDLLLYQCSNGHVILRRETIEKTENPLEVVK
jgi:hypothetical protein